MKTLIITLSLSLFLALPRSPCAQWVKTDSTYPMIEALAVNGTNIFAGTHGGGVWLTTDEGSHWKAVNNGLSGKYVSCLAIEGTNLYAGTGRGLSETRAGGIFLSTNSGADWMETTGGLTNVNITALGIQGTKLFVGTDSEGVYSSTDNGSSWMNANTGLIITYAHNVHAFIVIGSDLYAETAGNGLFRSIDSGNTWSATNSGLEGNALFVNSLAIIRNRLFAGSDGGGVFLSIDSATSWSAVNNGLNTNVRALAAFGNNLIAGTAGEGIFLSTDYGSSWISEDEGLPLGTGAVCFAIAGGYLFAGTLDHGIWRRPLSEMIGTNAVAPTPPPAHNLTAYPNPSTQSATMSFTSAESGEAEITIVNLLGEEVARLFAGTLAAGPHSFTWDARGMPPGVYECIARVNGSVERVRLVLLP